MRLIVTFFLVSILTIAIYSEPVMPNKNAKPAMSDGAVHIGLGFNGWHGGVHTYNYYVHDDNIHSENIYTYAPGLTFSVDAGAVNGMFSFGGDITVYFDQRLIDFYYPNGAYHSTHNLLHWGIAPLFRFGYHPFGMPTLKGKVAVANVLDPYIGLRIGASIGFMDTNGELDIFNNDSDYKPTDVDGDIIFTPTIGLRYYPHKVVGIWAEMDLTNFLIAVTFKL